MNYKLIKLEQEYIIISDQKIEINDYYIAWETNYADEPKERWVLYNLVSGLNGINQYKVVASTFIDELPDIDFNGLEEKFGIIDVEELAHKIMMNYLTNNNPEGDFKHSTIGADENKNWWVRGFNKCLALNKDKLYTSKDIIKAIAFGFGICRKFDRAPFDKEQVEFIQSLQPKTEWDIEIELETKCYCGHTNYCECGELGNKLFIQTPKINNNQIKILKIK